MSDDDRPKSFEETLRSIAAEVTKSAERLSQTDFGELERLARQNGLDPDRARGMADEAGEWLRRTFAGGMPGETTGADDPAPGPMAADLQPDDVTDAPIADGVPSPLDVPTAEQGQALAALDSGRWTVEPGEVALATQTGMGPQPRNAHALGLALHVRDWVDQDGQLTSAGGHALERWLESASDADDDE
ncbi:hypothetical protein [Patulibacter minatonensis]|uniref:hypothetical protein n=1 Tax=Patulibacter minatonensis TaxID=298163 RepID=UPI00047E8CDD|nr:hypothetical protein [Patulibacter minatonensis]